MTNEVTNDTPDTARSVPEIESSGGGAAVIALSADSSQLPPIILPTRRVRSYLHLIVFVAVGIASMQVWDNRGVDIGESSRFATVAGLAEQGTFAIERTPWAFTVDRVRIGNHIYSSKPPLLPSLVAGEYWLLMYWSHGQLTFRHDQADVVRIVTATFNLVPLTICLILLSRLVGSLTRHVWSQIFTMLVAATSYLVALAGSFNNHNVGACATFFAAFLAYRIWYDRRRTLWRFALCGLCIGFASTVEFSAVILLVLLLAGFFWIDPRRAIGFVVLAAVPLAAHFYTNHLVTGGWSPAYAHEDWYIFPGSYWHRDAAGHLVGAGIDALWEPWPVYLLNQTIGHHGVYSLQPVLLFSLLGTVRALIGRDRHRALAVVSMVLTIALFAIYTAFTDHRNYAGVTSMARYFIWLFPVWLMLIPAGVSWGARWKAWRFVAGLTLAISAASVTFSARHPWRFPWLDEVWRHFEKLPYD